MNLQEIKDAVESGKTVHFASEDYAVLKYALRDGSHMWIISHQPNGKMIGDIGLTLEDGVTVNGLPSQFWIAN
jgi:hypothetical protein